MARRKKARRKDRLKPLKAKLTGKSGNIPNNTSLLKYITEAEESCSVKPIPSDDLDSVAKSIFAKKRIPGDYVAPFSKMYKLKGLAKGRFEAKLRSIEFLLGQSEKDTNETTDTAIAALTDLLLLMYKRGRASKK